ncbi:MAG: iron-sulfur cluster assembly scaffold protein [Chloroflexi bacterium]|jgi:NifU-like protein involved in Fe-S cluster formation/metal-sulfur cluster biosynthetic enzyme|nr:iron-sulfur cluster assembly scaffold protein [Chloroflexota bacterium]
MPLPYSEIVMEHFRNPRNVGQIEDADAKSIEGSPACGDMVAVYLKVDPEELRISDVKFESYGCASNIATGSIITEMAKGKTLEEAKKISWKQASEALGGLPPIKTHCSVLAVDGLRAAIENYEERHGLVKERKPTTIEVVRKRLKRVMNPVVGLDLVRTNLVKEIEVSEGKVRVVIELPEDHQFAANIHEEIMEKIEPLWDVEQVVVEFLD